MSDTPQPPDITGTHDERVGLEYLEMGADKVIGRLQIEPHHHQPYGIVHGGVYCSIVESLASVGAAAWAGEHGYGGAVGLTNTTDFLRAISEGSVTATATPIHQGRSQQLWQVEVTRDSDGKPVAAGRVRLQHIKETSG
ncbi:MAG: hotdog fold thioesterase [Acidimicrobiia bacterium]|nr:hotdog fold thioesterase [Acidimicrobiia bacterium]